MDISFQYINPISRYPRLLRSGDRLLVVQEAVVLAVKTDGIIGFFAKLLLSLPR